MPRNGSDRDQIAPIFRQYRLGLAWAKRNGSTLQASDKEWCNRCIQLRGWVYWDGSQNVATDSVIRGPFRWLDDTWELHLREVDAHRDCESIVSSRTGFIRQGDASRFYQWPQWWCEIHRLNFWSLRLTEHQNPTVPGSALIINIFTHQSN